MTEKTVLITRIIPRAGIDLLKERYRVLINEHDRPLTARELLDLSLECDGLLCLLTDTIDKDFFEARPNIRAVANYAVGFNNIDIQAATARGIPVSNTPEVLTDATADLAFALIFSVARRIVQADIHLRSGEWGGWGPLQFLGSGVWGATLGVVGMGNIGRAVARRGVGLSMTVCYADDFIAAGTDFGFPATRLSLEELLETADFVSLHVPLTESTRHLIGGKELSRMKKTAYLINTSRGAVIDEAALAAALKNGDIAGAGLDVFEHEPKVTKKLCALPNTVLLPHIGSATEQARTNMAIMAAKNLIAMLEGDEIPNLVNHDYLKQGPS
ncbi:MAG: D-glycerate dehydrogenase [Deltaproteobacteria bacterium]|nr:D-glycerate dehydrogenase [Candidatus Zymogenaceae bacterium]